MEILALDLGPVNQRLGRLRLLLLQLSNSRRALLSVFLKPQVWYDHRLDVILARLRGVESQLTLALARILGRGQGVIPLERTRKKRFSLSY